MKARKLMLLGVDSMMMKRVDRFVGEGRMPNLQRLMERGVAADAYPTIPTSTGPNWTTIITGADSATHGVFSNNFNSDICQAERIWQSAEKAGKRSIILRYPGGWPPTVSDGIVLEMGGPANGLGVVCYSKCYTTAPLTTFHGAPLDGPRREPVEVTLKPAEGWTNLPESSAPPLACEIVSTPRAKGEAVTLHAVVTAAGPSGYDKVAICLSPDGASALSTIGVDEWSDFITSRFALAAGDRDATYRFKLIRLSPDAKEFILYRSQVYATEGFTHPPDLAQELIGQCGPFFDNPNRLLLSLGWFDNYFEEFEYHSEWLCNAAACLLKRERWDLFFNQIHSPDYAEHEWLGGIDPMSFRYRKDEASKWWEAFARDYELADRHLGRMLELADDDTLVVVVSDHGHIIGRKKLALGNVLAKAGLIAVDEQGNVDDARSKVLVGGGHGALLVNVKGRQPNGCVEPGAEFERVRDQAIDALYGLRDEEEGRRAVAVVLRREEAGVIGLGTEKVHGDLIVFPAPGYTENLRYEASAPETGIILPDPKYGAWPGSEGTHAHLPSVDYSEGSITSSFIMAGPGVRRGVRRDKPIFLRDVTPTMAHLLGIPCPRNSDGAVLHDLLEG